MQMMQLVPVLRKSPDKQTNKQTDKQTNKQLDQSQDIVTGNEHVSCKKSYNIDLISAYLPGNSDLHNSSRSNVIELNEI